MLSLLDLVLELAHSTQVGADISSCLLLVLLDEVVDDTVIEVLTTKVGVTSSCQDLKDTIVKIIHDDLQLPAFLVKTVGDSGSGGFIDDAKNLKACNCTSILSCLMLSIIEVLMGTDKPEEGKIKKIGLHAGTVTTACVTF